MCVWGGGGGVMFRLREIIVFPSPQEILAVAVPRLGGRGVWGGGGEADRPVKQTIGAVDVGVVFPEPEGICPSGCRNLTTDKCQEDFVLL